VTFAGYFFLNKKRYIVGAKYWLIGASLFFYSWWNIVYLPLIVLSVVINYILTVSMQKQNYKKKLLYIGLAFNIGLLGYFKYADFFISNINLAFSSDINLLHLALPLAISFFTLQQIAFLVDSYGGLAKEESFLDYFLFVVFFPQLIAGPIVHHKEMMPQFAKVKNKVVNYENIAKGLFVFSIGLFKKVVIADTFAQYASAGFASADKLNLIEGWVTSLSYTFQLYFDFSGYTDMAIGIALFFNIALPQNFNSPYKSTSIIEFWFIAGLWHGAAWTFVVFGALHGGAIVINHYWKKSKNRLPTYLAWFLTFNFLNLSFVVFRADSLKDAVSVFRAMFSGDLVLDYRWYEKFTFLHGKVEFGAWLQHVSATYHSLWYLLFAFVGVLVFYNSQKITNIMKPNMKFLVAGTLVFTVAVLQMHRVSEFLYFNF